MRVPSQPVVKSAFTSLCILSILIISLSGCGGQQSTPPPPPVTLASIIVAASTQSIPLGTTQQFTATGHYSDGSTRDLSSSAVWTSSVAGVATVSASGLVTSHGQGTSVITVTVGSVSGSANLTVTAPALVSITISPANASAPLGATRQFTAVGTYTDSSTATPSGLVSSSSAPNIATVDASGLLKTMAIGTATITATSGSVTASTTFVVTPAELVTLSITPSSLSLPLGRDQQLVITGTYTDASTKDLGSEASWTSSAPSVANITSAGLLTSLAQGAATITATFGSLNASTGVTITAPVVASISVAPVNAAVPLGRTQQFTATATYTDKTVSPATNVTWTSSDAGIATVDATGLLVPLAQGTTTVTAAAGSVMGSVTVTVAPPDLVSLTVTAPEQHIPLGLTLQLTATGTFTDNSTKDISAAVTWSSSSLSVGEVSVSGLLSTHAEGQITITATSQSLTGSTLVTVDPPALVSIAIDPATVGVGLGNAPATQFTATGTYTDHSTTDITSKVTWSSSNQFVATLSNVTETAGQATPVREGVTSVFATSGDVKSKARLAVYAVSPLALITASLDFSVTPLLVDTLSGQLRPLGYANTMQHTATTASTPFTNCVTVDPSRKYVYAINPGNVDTAPTISAYKLDLNAGTLVELSTSPFGAPIVPERLGCLVFEPSGKFAYAPEYDSNVVVGYQLEADTGRLILLGTFTAGNGPDHIAIDPVGRFLYVNNSDLANSNPTVMGFAIDASTGSLQPIAGATVSVLPHENNVSVHPLGQFLYVSHTDGKSIFVYAIDAVTGALAPVPNSTVTPGVNPGQLQFDIWGDAFTACRADGTVVAYNIDDATGMLTQLGSPIAVGEIPGVLRVDSTGRFLYVNDGYDNVRLYQRGTNAQYEYVRAFATRHGISSMVFVPGTNNIQNQPYSRWAYTGDATTSTLKTYVMDLSSGGLQVSAGLPDVVLTGTPLQTVTMPWASDLFVLYGTSNPVLADYTINRSYGTRSPSPFSTLALASVTPAGVALDPSARFLYVSDTAANLVHAYVRATGLFEIFPLGSPAFPLSGGPGALAVDPNGRYLFVVQTATKTIAVLDISGSSGGLTDVTGTTPATTGNGPVALTTDPAGNFLYVANRDDNTITYYTIDYYNNGKLIAAGNPVSVAGAPTAIAPDTTGKYLYVVEGSTLHIYSVDLLTGVPSEAAPPVTTAAPITGIYAELSGRYAYVTTSGGIEAFTINYANGTLSPISGSPFAVGSQPMGLAIIGTAN